MGVELQLGLPGAWEGSWTGVGASEAQGLLWAPPPPTPGVSQGRPQPQEGWVCVCRAGAAQELRGRLASWAAQAHCPHPALQPLSFTAS